MFPALFGCRTPSELSRVRGWDKNWPSRLLRVFPKRSWLKRLRRLGLEVLVPLWRQVESKSEATRSRWQWTCATDDSVFHKYGEQLSLVGHWWSGQQHRVLSGIDGLLLVVVIRDGRLVVMVDEPGQERFYLLCLETTLSGPLLIRKWRRRNWIEFVFRVLNHLMATESWQAHSEDAYYDHLVLRLMASFVLFYTSRVICKGRLTMEEISFSLKHYWRFVDMAPLELQALS